MIGVGGLCSVYDPPVSYWCSEHPSGGGAFPFRTPSGVIYKPPNGPYEHGDFVVIVVVGGCSGKGYGYGCSCNRMMLWNQKSWKKVDNALGINLARNGCESRLSSQSSSICLFPKPCAEGKDTTKVTLTENWKRLCVINGGSCSFPKWLSIDNGFMPRKS